MFFNSVNAAELLSGLLAKRLRQLPNVSATTAKSTEPMNSEEDSLTQETFWRQIQDFLQPGDVIITDTGTSFFGSAGLQLPEGASFVAQPIWAALGYSLPAVLGTALAAPGRRQLVFIGDGAIQMTVQELSTILRLNLKPIVFLVNNDGYTIERLILGETRATTTLIPGYMDNSPPLWIVTIRLTFTWSERIPSYRLLSPLSATHRHLI